MVRLYAPHASLMNAKINNANLYRPAIAPSKERVGRAKNPPTTQNNKSPHKSFNGLGLIVGCACIATVRGSDLLDDHPLFVTANERKSLRPDVIGWFQRN